MYSFKKGFWKGVLSLVSVLGAVVALMGFSDMTIWSLIEQHIKPLVGALTIGGVITIITNWIKFHYFS